MLFVLVASSPIIGPVLAHKVARQRVEAQLDVVRAWLTSHNATVMSVLMLVVGVSLIGKGLSGPG